MASDWSPDDLPHHLSMENRVSRLLADKLSRNPHLFILCKEVLRADKEVVSMIWASWNSDTIDSTPIRPGESNAIAVSKLIFKIYERLKATHPDDGYQGCHVCDDRTRFVADGVDDDTSYRFSEIRQTREYILHRALIIADAQNRVSRSHNAPFRLLELPLELRLKIYEYALPPVKNLQWYSECFCRSHDDFLDCDVALLRVCRQIHEEAEAQFYAGAGLDCQISVEVAVPFLERLSPTARSKLKTVRMELIWWDPSLDDGVFTSGYWMHHDNLQHWVDACNYISHNLQISEFSFDVTIRGVPAPEDFRTDAWVSALIGIRGLKELDQREETFRHLRHEMAQEGDVDYDQQCFEDDRFSLLLKYLKSEMLANYDAEKSEEIWDANQLYIGSKAHKKAIAEHRQH